MVPRDEPSLRAAEALLAAGRTEAAERLLLGLTRHPGLAGHAFVQLARIALCGRPPRPAAARRRVERAMAAGLDGAAVHHLAAACHEQLGDDAAAVRFYAMACARDPDDPELHSAHGNALRRLGHLDESLAAHRRALVRGATRATVWSNYGLGLRAAGAIEDSLEAFARAVALRPDHAELRHNLGNARLRAARDDAGLREASETLRDAMALDPSGPTGQAARVDLATALGRLGRHEAAIELLTEATERHPTDPAARYNLALALLRRGGPDDWAPGWSMYEARRQLVGFPVARATTPDWDGAPHPEGHLCLSAEQGLGDTIQFARFVAPAAERFAGAVTLIVPDRLRPWLSGLREPSPGLEVVGNTDRDAALSRATHHLPLMSLVHRLGCGPHGLPGRAGYLGAERLRRHRWSAWLDADPRPSRPILRVGIAWQGNPHYAGDRDRSVPLAWFGALAGVPGVELISLQRGDGEIRFDGPEAFDLRRPPPGFDDDGAFVDTAALIAELDLVVSSDTSVLHVAAAMGAEVWCPLAARCDWRWGRSGEGTPWYRHLHLFRQTTPGDWSDVFERLRVALTRKAEAHPCRFESTSAQAS